MKVRYVAEAKTHLGTMYVSGKNEYCMDIYQAMLFSSHDAADDFCWRNDVPLEKVTTVYIYIEFIN